jgi:hypothetical protein
LECLIRETCLRANFKVNVFIFVLLKLINTILKINHFLEKKLHASIGLVSFGQYGPVSVKETNGTTISEKLVPTN